MMMIMMAALLAPIRLGSRARFPFASGHEAVAALVTCFIGIAVRDVGAKVPEHHEVRLQELSGTP